MTEVTFYHKYDPDKTISSLNVAFVIALGIVQDLVPFSARGALLSLEADNNLLPCAKNVLEQHANLGGQFDLSTDRSYLAAQVGRARFTIQFRPALPAVTHEVTFKFQTEGEYKVGILNMAKLLPLDTPLRVGGNTTTVRATALGLLVKYGEEAAT